MPLSTQEVKDAALAERGEEVKLALTAKYKVLAERQGQIDAAANYITSTFAEDVKAFEDALAAADTNEKVMATLEAHKFPKSFVRSIIGSAPVPERK